MCYLDRTFLMLLTRAHIGGCAKNHCESIMKPDLPGSLRTKLLAIVLVTTLVALIVALCAIVGYDVRLYQQAWVADMETQAQLIGRTTAAAITFDDAKVAR